MLMVCCRLCAVPVTMKLVVCCRLCAVPVMMKLFNSSAVVLRVDVDTRLSHGGFVITAKLSLSS